jgi:hypothetical protein
MAQDELQLGAVADSGAGSGERVASGGVFEAQATQRLKCPRLQVRAERRNHPTIESPIGVLEREPRPGAARHAQRTAMACSMMSTTKGDQIFELVPLAFFARLDVVHVQKICVAAARCLAAMLVSTQHGAAHSWRHVLGGALHLAAGLCAHDYGVALQARTKLCWPSFSFCLFSLGRDAQATGYLNRLSALWWRTGGNPSVGRNRGTWSFQPKLERLERGRRAHHLWTAVVWLLLPA